MKEYQIAQAWICMSDLGTFMQKSGIHYNLTVVTAYTVANTQNSTMPGLAMARQTDQPVAVYTVCLTDQDLMYIKLKYHDIEVYPGKPVCTSAELA